LLKTSLTKPSEINQFDKALGVFGVLFTNFAKGGNTKLKSKIDA
jgi:hypothetical protein